MSPEKKEEHLFFVLSVSLSQPAKKKEKKVLLLFLGRHNGWPALDYRVESSSTEANPQLTFVWTHFSYLAYIQNQLILNWSYTENVQLLLG